LHFQFSKKSSMRTQSTIAHKAPAPEPDDDPIPEEEPTPEEDPAPHPDPVGQFQLPIEKQLNCFAC
jgi:hypothetical protein